MLIWTAHQKAINTCRPVSCLKITFPYLWFITFVALSGAVLNTYNKFAVAAFTPVFLNIAMIGAAIYLAPQMQNPAEAIAWGVFLGGLIQFLFQLPFLAKAGLLVMPRWGLEGSKRDENPHFNDPGVIWRVCQSN